MTKTNVTKPEFEIEEHICVLSEAANGWKKELNKVSWNKADAKYDIRSWSDDHTKCSKGVTLTEEEMEILKEADF
jgi:hypothetical protein